MNNLNISIDDVSPHPKSSTKVLERCFELIEIFNDIKFTLFIPTAYWRTVKPDISTDAPLVLSDYPEFCSEVRSLPSKNFEIGYHGHYHGIPGYSDNDEFKNLSYQEALDKVRLMKLTVKNAGLENTFSPIFRPPAWKMSPDCFKAFKDEGINNFAIFPLNFVKYGWTQAESYKKEDDNSEYIKSYATCFPPMKDLKLEKDTNIVYHACEWDKNYLSPELSKDLELFLSSRKEDFTFNFINN